MIGVISRPDQAAVVEEFFELFKTPWEFFNPRHRYDVAIVTATDIPEIETRLLLAYSPETTSIDAPNGITIVPVGEGGVLDCMGTALPIYGTLARVEGVGRRVLSVTPSAELAGLYAVPSEGPQVIRVGYDLFHEIRLLLSDGQPIQHAHIPTLDRHIRILRKWILDAGIPLVEVPPVPASHAFSVCLTHDIDFAGVRDHRFDHTMWGFVYRSTLGAVWNFLRRRLSLQRLLKAWRAAASLPFVYLGWAKDFWDPFEWYSRVEKDLPATYFLIPFKNRRGERVSGRNVARRAAAYDITDVGDRVAPLLKNGCELGVHGIDAWHSVEKGRHELARVAAATGEAATGIRVHWLLRNDTTACVLEAAGYAYDSSIGYNETVGYRSGTTQVFRPWGAQRLLELPLHIQDGALFYPRRLDLSEQHAWDRCRELIDTAQDCGGVLTILWHDRSHGPERFWGDFYIRLVQTLKSLRPWFGTGRQVVAWFQKRRRVRFHDIEGADGSRRTLVCCHDGQVLPPLRVRLHRPGSQGDEFSETATFVDIEWDGETDIELESDPGGGGESLRPQAYALGSLP